MKHFKYVRVVVIIMGAIFILTAASFILWLNAPNEAIYKAAYASTRIGSYLLVAGFGVIGAINLTGLILRKK